MREGGNMRECEVAGVRERGRECMSLRQTPKEKETAREIC